MFTPGEKTIRRFRGCCLEAGSRFLSAGEQSNRKLVSVGGASVPPTPALCESRRSSSDSLLPGQVCFLSPSGTQGTFLEGMWRGRVQRGWLARGGMVGSGCRLHRALLAGNFFCSIYLLNVCFSGDHFRKGVVCLYPRKFCRCQIPGMKLESMSLTMFE